MENNNLRKQLFELYKQLFKLRVVGNENLILPTFHVFIGSILDIKLEIGGQFLPLTIHCFILQPPTTGKGGIFKMFHDLLRAIGKKSIIENRFTEAGIVGTARESKVTGVDYRPGPLLNHNLVIVDEAKALLIPGPYSEHLKSTLNGYLNNNHVTKSLGPGWLSQP